MKNLLTAIITAVALSLSGCYGAQSADNWIAVEDAGTSEFDALDGANELSPDFAAPPVLWNCDTIAVNHAINQCDFCSIMEDKCPGWLDEHTQEGVIMYHGAPLTNYNCYDWEDAC